MKKETEYKKNTCSYCLYWQTDCIGISGRCYHPDGYDMLLYDSEKRCEDNYRENTYIINYQEL